MSVPTTRHFDADCVGRTVPAAIDGTRMPQTAGTARPTSASASVQGDDAPEPPCFSLAALLHDLRPHAELDLRTLAYHLRQCDATAADGYCHAAINEARSFLEALVVNIVQSVRRDAKGDVDTPLRERVQNGTAFRTYRRCLLDAGFIDPDENELLQYVYSVASAKGGHHGVTDEAWTRLARRIVFATGQYLLHRYAAWKYGERSRPPARPAVSCASGNGSWRGWLGRILRWPVASGRLKTAR